MTPCPVPSCLHGAHDGHLMCLSCWKRVPFKQQMAVQRAWRNFQQAVKPNMKIACLRAYRAARNQAIAAVSPKENA